MLEDSAPFHFPAQGERAGAAGAVGALCIHGFTGSPQEMRYLGQRLSARGIRSLGVLLPGHGTEPADLASVRWQDWYEAVERGLDELGRDCDRVGVVGMSLGGLLALHLAHQRGGAGPGQVAAVAALATPLWLSGLVTAVVRATGSGRLLRRVLPVLPKLGGADTRDPVMRARSTSYRKFPVEALHQVVALMELVRRDLHQIAVPTLVLHARQDHTAPLGSAYEIASRVRHSRLHILSDSFHNIAVDVERDIVAAQVGVFLDQHLGLSAQAQARPPKTHRPQTSRAPTSEPEVSP